MTRTLTSVTLLLLLALAACQSDRDRGIADGARKGAVQGKEEGASYGRQRGAEDGRAAGAAWATEEANRGRWAGIYVRPAVIAVLIGFAVGIALQWVFLGRLANGRTSEAWAAVFIPELTRSIAYQRWQALRQILADAHQQLYAQRLSHERQIEALNNLIEVIRKAERIEELSQTRIRELVDAEIARARDRMRRGK